MATSSDDPIRVNPYTHLSDKVRGVQDRQGRPKRGRERRPDEPHDVVELGGDVEEPPQPLPGSEGDSLDIAV